MRTTKKELREMLATGEVIQERHTTQDRWWDLTDDDINFDVDYYEYRLKPKITYYCVALDTMNVFKSDKPFSIYGPNLEYYFQIEE